MELLAQLDPNHVNQIVSGLSPTGRIVIHYSDGTQTVKEVGGKKEKKPSPKSAIHTNRSGSKSDLARALLVDLQEQGKSRQEIIEAFVQEIGLTKAGASTYYYNLTKK